MTRFWITMDQAMDLVMYAHAAMEGREIFIPKIPSIKITDLAEAIAGNTFWIETSIRPGEKLHECLITEDESRTTLEIGKYYIIYPEWRPGGIVMLPKDLKPTDTKIVKEGFRYTSDGNDEWLSVDQLKELHK
jgi:UDP-N-acetylglucosamine 4,6-dehydratase